VREADQPFFSNCPVARCSIKYKYYERGSIYIREVRIDRDGEQYGTYYQAVRSSQK
jgi:hypothetical protein